MSDYLGRAAGEAAEPEVDTAGFPDLFVSLNVRNAMVGGHGY